jgi:hypothetical protein
MGIGVYLNYDGRHGSQDLHFESLVSVQLSPLNKMAVKLTGFVNSKHLSAPSSTTPQSSGSFVHMPESMHPVALPLYSLVLKSLSNTP